MNKLTQKDRLLRHMRDYGSITRAEAMDEYGIANVTARMSELVQAGYIIRKTTVGKKNRYGEPTHFTKYSLGGEPNDHSGTNQERQ